MKKLIFAVLATFQLFGLESSSEKSIVILIPSYNNERWVEKNLTSVFSQNYTNYKIIYINDFSTDNTLKLVRKLFKKANKYADFHLIQNKFRKGALRNLYEAIHNFCNNTDIVVTLDGDDWLPHSGVLEIINQTYSQEKNIWLTFGSYIMSNGHSPPQTGFSEKVINNNLFRNQQLPSHLRTFYAGLFKKIKKEDLLHNGKFYEMAWDVAMMFPMIEMAGDRHAFINQAVYVYNIHNPISDFRTNSKLQTTLEDKIRKKEKYQRLNDLSS